MLCKPYRKFAQENAMQKARAENTANNYFPGSETLCKAYRSPRQSLDVQQSGPEGAAGVCRGVKELQEFVAA